MAQFSTRLRSFRDFTAAFARLLAAYTSARFQKKLQAIARHRDVRSGTLCVERSASLGISEEFESRL